MKEKSVKQIRAFFSLSLVWLFLVGSADCLADDKPLYNRYLNSDSDFVAWLDVSSFTDQELEQIASLFRIKLLGIRDVVLALRHSQTTRVALLGNAAEMISQGAVVLVECDDPEKLQQSLQRHPILSALTTRRADQHLLIATNEVQLDAATRSSVGTEIHVLPANLVKGLESFAGRVGIVVAPKTELTRLIAQLPGINDDPNFARFIAAISKLEFGFATQISSAGELNVQFRFSTPDACQLFCRTANHWLQQTFDLPEARKFLRAEQNLATLVPEYQAELIGAIVKKVESTSAQNTSMNNLRQLVLACLNHESAFQQFPPQALCDETGNRLLSWRVLMLPYLEQQSLYEQFKLDEPWDSPHNFQLISKMPEIFASGESEIAADQIRRGLTCFVAPLTPDSVMGRPGNPMKFGDLKDGSSNTILFVEVLPEHAVPWTKPADWIVDLNNPFLALVNDEMKTFPSCRVDGSTGRFTSKLGAAKFKALLSVDDGEIVDDKYDE